MDSVVQNHAKQRAAPLRIEIRVRVYGDARSDRLEPIDRSPVDPGSVGDGPVQVANRNGTINLSERANSELILGGGETVLLKRPPIPGDRFQSRIVIRRGCGVA